MGKPHKHAELIKAWADGAEIECADENCDNWQPCLSGSNPLWLSDVQYRIKPEPEYPKSSLTDAVLIDIYFEAGARVGVHVGALRAIADAAVARHCQDQEKENV